MPTYPLPYRITAFLKRQIAWSEAVVREIDAFCAAPEGTDVGPVLSRQQQRDHEIQAMAREYRGLAREWEAAADLTDEERAGIRLLSAEAESLTEQVRQRYRQAEARAQSARSHNRDSLNELRRGRRSVTIYEPGGLVSPGFIDKEA